MYDTVSAKVPEHRVDAIRREGENLLERRRELATFKRASVGIDEPVVAPAGPALLHRIANTEASAAALHELAGEIEKALETLELHLLGGGRDVERRDVCKRDQSEAERSGLLAVAADRVGRIHEALECRCGDLVHIRDRINSITAAVVA